MRLEAYLSLSNAFEKSLPTSPSGRAKGAERSGHPSPRRSLCAIGFGDANPRQSLPHFAPLTAGITLSGDCNGQAIGFFADPQQFSLPPRFYGCIIVRGYINVFACDNCKS